MKKIIAWLLTIAISVCVGFGIDRWWSHRPAPVPESAAPAVAQADGSVVIERAGPSAPRPKPPHQLPKGSTEERRVSVTVAPLIGPGIKLPANATTADCPPLEVDLSLVKMPDETRRVVASSPDGRIVGGLDIPVEPINFVAPRKWSAGLSLDPIHQTPGVWLDRDWSRLRIGVEINQTRVFRGGPTGAEARVRVGVIW
ncbi:MAG: hypothetical protein KGP14_04000 [Betaproteobacteria bacterium]|nr:hypothetical protein [Betaproteobacteria bacterium]